MCTPECRDVEQTDEEIVDQAKKTKNKRRLNEEEEEGEEAQHVSSKGAKRAIETLCCFAILHGFDEHAMQLETR